MLIMGSLVGVLVAGLLLFTTPVRGQTADAQHPPPEIIAREPLRDLLLHPEDLRHADTQEMPDGYPLFAQQVPRFIEPTHEGEWGFDDFLVLGDYPTVTFWHYDWRFDQGLGERETWHRTDTRTILGRLVSVFRPRWPASTLRELLGKQWWGVDTPSFLMGRIGVPGSTRRLGIRVTMAPPNVPESQVIRINDDM